MKSRPLLVLLLLIAIPAIAFWGRVQWHKFSERKKAEYQAVWMARIWSEGILMDDLCREAAKAGSLTILREEWDTGSSDDIVLGPVVSGRRVCVRRDRSVYWRSAK
ncbi:MAG TPA: hypothetical protein VGE67_06830 [Haloferula sp.]